MKKGTLEENPKEWTQKVIFHVAQLWLKTLPLSTLKGDLKGCASKESSERSRNIFAEKVELKTDLREPQESAKNVPGEFSA